MLHTHDSDSGQNKPLRIWLSETFFTSRGIQVDEIRDWLGKFKRWAAKNGLTEKLRQRYEKHLVRIERIGIDLKSRHSLRNRLHQIKRWVVSPDLARDKAQAMATIEKTLAKRSALEQQLDETNQNIRQLAKRKTQNSYYQQFKQWSVNGGMTPIQVMMLQNILDCGSRTRRRSTSCCLSVPAPLKSKPCNQSSFRLSTRSLRLLCS